MMWESSNNTYEAVLRVGMFWCLIITSTFMISLIHHHIHTKKVSPVCCVH